VSSPLADMAAGFRQVADALARLADQPAQTGRAIPQIEMLTPEAACEVVAGRTPGGELRIAPKTLARKTKGMDFRRGGQGQPLTYERAGLERWLRNQ
jgi:hypothetical protein